MQLVGWGGLINHTRKSNNVIYGGGFGSRGICQFPKRLETEVSLCYGQSPSLYVGVPPRTLTS